MRGLHAGRDISYRSMYERVLAAFDLSDDSAYHSYTSLRIHVCECTREVTRLGIVCACGHTQSVERNDSTSLSNREELISCRTVQTDTLPCLVSLLWRP